MTLETDYKKFKIPIDVKNKGKIILDLPNKCPICGGKSIGGEYKYRITYNKYLMIPICEEHYEIMGSKPKQIKILIIPFLFFLLTFIPSLFISIITQIYWISLFIIIIDVLFFLAYTMRFGITMIKYNSLEGDLHNKIRIGYIKDKNIVISTYLSEWLELVLSLNEYDEIDNNSLEIEIYKNKLYNWFKILLVYLVISIPSLVILSLFFDFILIGYFIIVLGVFIILMFIIYILIKIQEFKTAPISLGGKLCLLILFSFIFLIMTLEWFFQ